METIDPRYLLRDVAKILEEINIPYCVTGGMAVYKWGRPRFTADIDIVIQLVPKDIDILAEKLLTLSEASYISKDAMQRALMRHGEFNFVDGNTNVKVDFWIMGNGEFHKNQLRRRIPEEVYGQIVYFVSPEDLILSKLLWHKESESTKQLEDIQSVIKVQKILDWEYLNKWVKAQETWNILESLKKSIK